MLAREEVGSDDDHATTTTSTPSKAVTAPRCPTVRAGTDSRSHRHVTASSIGTGRSLGHERADEQDADADALVGRGDVEQVEPVADRLDQQRARGPYR